MGLAGYGHKSARRHPRVRSLRYPGVAHSGIDFGLPGLVPAYKLIKLPATILPQKDGLTSYDFCVLELSTGYTGMVMTGWFAWIHVVAEMTIAETGITARE